MNLCIEDSKKEILNKLLQNVEAHEKISYLEFMVRFTP